MGENAKIFVDNFNRIAGGSDLEEFLSSERTSPTYEGISEKFSARIQYNYPTEESIRTLTGKDIKFSYGVSPGDKDLALGRIRDYWNSLDEVNRNALNRGVGFLSDEALRAMGEGEGVVGLANFDGSFFLRADERGANFGIFRHELAHLLQYKLGGVEPEEAQTLINQMEVLQENKNNILDEIQRINLEPPTPENEAMKTFLEKNYEENREQYYQLSAHYDVELDKRVRNSPFVKEWENIAGDVYKKYTKYGVKGLSELGYIDGSPDNVPKYGLIRSYGGTNSLEDMSTFVEEAVKSPKTFAPLINPESPLYDSIYRNKIEFLYKYKFISDSEYNKILQTAGVQ